MTERVLLVEDDPDDLELTLAAFETACFSCPIEVARDGEEALRRLRAAKTPPTLVILDLNLPKVSGLEVLERMRLDARLKRVPAVVLSSSDDLREKSMAAAVGALAFLRKPLVFEEFAAVVDELKLILARIRSGAHT